MASEDSPSQRKTMGRVMHEYAHGELKSGRSGKGGKVKSRRQAIAIALEGGRRIEVREQEREQAQSRAEQAQGSDRQDLQQEREGKSQVGARGRRETQPRRWAARTPRPPTRRTPKQRAAAKRNIRKAQTARRRAA